MLRFFASHPHFQAEAQKGVPKLRLEPHLLTLGCPLLKRYCQEWHQETFSCYKFLEPPHFQLQAQKGLPRLWSLGGVCIDFIVSFVRNSIRRQFHVMKFYIPLPQPALGVTRVGLEKPLRTSLVKNKSFVSFSSPLEPKVLFTQLNQLDIWTFQCSVPNSTQGSGL